MSLKKGSHPKARSLRVAAQSYKNTDCGRLENQQERSFLNKLSSG